MASSSKSEAQLKSEIARLTASINQHKSGVSVYTQGRSTGRNNTYVNPNYKPPNKYIRPTTTAVPHTIPQPRPVPQQSTQVKDVVLNGVAFESSGRSLVRKDLPKPVSSTTPKPRPLPPPPHQTFSRKAGHLIPTTRVYKPKTSRRGGRFNRNMTLASTRTSYQARREANKRLKYSDKPCPRFTTTGACTRGLTCFYQHDPSKIAICWNFLQGNCTNTADSCNLSHDPTPERTPLCLHFLNNGRCTRDKCPFPHVNVGARQGVCRDFAVLGYCSKGLDCDKQHVRECPDFAEKGACSTKGCKLPHVIRANRTRKPGATSEVIPGQPPPAFDPTAASKVVGDGNANGVSTLEQQEASHVTADQAQLGDEYISLTFHESESSEEESDDDDDNDDDDNDDSEGEEGDDPNKETTEPE